MPHHPSADVKGVFSELSSVRAHCHEILQLAYHNKLEYFHYDPSKLVTVLQMLLNTVKEDEKLLSLPYQNCWRYLESHVTHMDQEVSGGFLERGRAFFDLALLATWFDIPHPADQNGERFSLNVVSRLWRAGTFSNDPQNPLRVDQKTAGAILSVDCLLFFRKFGRGIAEESDLIPLACGGWNVSFF